jgi:hypothetical protein
MDRPNRIRHLYRVQIAPKIDRQLDQAVIETCMTKVTIVTRVLEWFCRQNHNLRGIVLGLFSNSNASQTSADSLDSQV